MGLSCIAVVGKARQLRARALRLNSLPQRKSSVLFDFPVAVLPDDFGNEFIKQFLLIEHHKVFTQLNYVVVYFYQRVSIV
jgi:hypothetical protein